MGGDQGGADARVETNLFIDGFCVTLEGAGVSSLGLAKHRADQAIKHIDGPISQTGGNVQTNGDQRGVSPAAFVASDMLGGGASGFARKLGEPRLMDQVATAWFDANLTDVFQTLDQTEHRGWVGGFWHLLQPGEPTQTGRFATLRERIKPASLFGGQAFGQPTMHFPTGYAAQFGAEALDGGRRGNNNSALPARLDGQRSQIGEPIIFDGLWRQATCQLSGGLFAEWTKPELALTLDGVTPAIPRCNEILVYRVRKNPDLFGDESEQRRRRPLAGAQGAAGIAQIAKHERVAETIVIATAAQNRHEIIG